MANLELIEVTPLREEELRLIAYIRSIEYGEIMGVQIQAGVPVLIRESTKTIRLRD